MSASLGALGALPAGYEPRRPTGADVAGIYELVDAHDRVLLGRSDLVVQEVRELLDHRGSPLDTDHWVVERRGRIVAWAGVVDRFDADSLEVEMYVHPDVPGRDGARDTIIDALFAALLGRLRERCERMFARGRRRGDVPGCLTVDAWAQVGDDEYDAVLRSRGFTPVRRFSEMRIDLTAGFPEPTPPPGVVLEPFDPSSDADWHEWHAVMEEAFAEHWGHQPRSLDLLRRWIDGQDDPEIERWRFAVVDGRRAGACQTAGRSAAEGGGWIQGLGVLPRARGRGAGRHLLESALAAYAADGRSWAGLGVDTENATGALALYEAVGMSASSRADVYRRLFRAG